MIDNITNIYIGTSGWSYKHWKGIFYPESLSQKNWLKYYFERYSTVEINNTFYRLPEEQTFINWRDAVPENFIFSVKANRYITHVKRLNNIEEELNLFLNRAKLLENKLGVILFQFPPGFKLNIERLNKLVIQLPQSFTYTLEFRDASWWVQDTFNLLSEYNIAFCIYEMPGVITPREVTADFVYIRFHSPFSNYVQFEKPLLMDWSEFILDCYSKGKKVYCYFNNDWLGYALQDSVLLREILKDKLGSYAGL